MTASVIPLQGPARAPSPPIPALPGAPGAATAARQAAEAATAAQRAASDADRAAQEAARIAGQPTTDPAIADVPAPPAPPSLTTTTGFPVDPAEIIREAVPIFGMSLAMMIVLFIGWPLARAFARRADNRSKLEAGTSRALEPQIRQLQESLDLMAVELERISESQRFQAKLLAERAVPEEQRRL